MNDDGPSGGSETAGESPADGAEIRRLRAERDALSAELEEVKGHRPRRLRRVAVGVLVALSSLLVVLSTTVVWAHRTLLETDVFVATVGPTIDQPGVHEAVATRSADELFTALEVEKRLHDALPPRIAFAAGPIATAVKGQLRSELTKVIASPEFHKLWNDILTVTHRQVVQVLRSQHSELLSVSHGFIVLNTVPLVNEALAHISSVVSGIVGHPITFPTIKSGELPQSAIDKLSDALGVKLPTSFGQIDLIRADHLTIAQRGVSAFDRLTILLPILTAVLIALTLWLSLSRRRTLIQLVAVTAILVVAMRRIMIYEEASLSKSAHDPQVAHEIFAQLLSGFYDGTQWILWAALVILVVALITGPYPWARALRRWVRQGWDWLAGELGAENRAKVARWTARHAGVLQLGAAVVAFILLIVVSASWISVLVIGVLLAVCEVYLGSKKEQPTTGDAGSPVERPPVKTP